MRRVLVPSALLVAGAVALAACKHDGRELRPARADQNLSISSTSAPPTSTTEPTVIAPAGSDAVTITAPWQDGAAIDARYTCDGQNLAPAMSWSAPPSGVVEVAITMEDVQEPTFVHWVMAGISPDATTIGEGIAPLGAVEARNGSGGIGYTGPCPPSGSTHEYTITVHFLAEPSSLDDGDPGATMLQRIGEIEIASATVSGTYSRG